MERGHIEYSPDYKSKWPGCQPMPLHITAEGERIKRLETALQIAATTLEQIASTPRNKGARLNASATLWFLKTHGLL